LDASSIRDSDIICVSRSPDFSPDSVSRWNSPLAIDSTDNSIEEKEGPFNKHFPANVVHTSSSVNFNFDPSSDKEDVSFEDYNTINNRIVTPVTTSSSPRSDNSLPEWVRLDVGGKKFVTTRTTLTKERDSMLAKMFSGQWNSARDEKGAYLIDRSPEYFEPILNYLRTGTIVLDDGVNVEGVLQEAKFFNISSMVDPLTILLEQSKKEISRKDFVNILVTSSTNVSLRCQGLNLSGIDLSKLDLSLINFKQTNLRYANLRGCNLDNTQLQGADLTGAVLENASLRGANLSGANLTGAVLRGANFEDRGGLKANLESCKLIGANLEDTNLSGANLRAAKLKGANLENANLRSCDLAAADIEGANLRGCNLHKTNLKGANLINCNFDIRSISSR
jgi:uncharacterized protein YjbI with pentapeptide repeats